MHYTDLDSIIEYFKSTSSYYEIKKPNNITVKILARNTLTLATILVIVIKSLNINFLDLFSLIITTLVGSFFLSAFLLNRKINKKTNEYIENYNIVYSLDLKIYDQVRFDNFYRYLLNNNINSLSDENFNILITYIKTQEEILNGDPSYNSRKTLVTNSTLAFIVSASSALISKFITNYNQLFPFILISLIILYFIYTFLTSIIDFPNKITDEKDSYKCLKIFLYKAKFRYNSEHTKDNLTDTKTNLEDSKKINTTKEDFRSLSKTKLHKIIDILLQ